MAVSLYTSRVVLNTLGVADYGVYNVTGGVIAMFAFLNTAMSSATQRYITFALGTGNKKRLQTVFTTSVQIHFIISLAFCCDYNTLEKNINKEGVDKWL